MIKKILFIFLLSISLVLPLTTFIKNKNNFLSSDYSQNYKQYKKDYFSSQYMIKKHPMIIPDEILESYAGGAFLKGLNPILMVSDQPPLGRYITALSILLFNNQNIILLILLGISAWGIFLVGKKVLTIHT